MRRWLSFLDRIGWTPLRRQMSVQGSLDGVFDAMICGWAWNPGAPSERVAVTLRIDGSARTVVADRFRADLADLGKGDGRCGFAVPLRLFEAVAPAAEIEAFVGEARLPGSPRPSAPADEPISIGKNDLVRLVFRALLGRDPHPDDLSFYARSLKHAESIEDLLVSISSSKEFQPRQCDARGPGEAFPPEAVDAAMAALVGRLPTETQHLLKPSTLQASAGRLPDRTARSLLRTAALLGPDTAGRA